MTLAELVEAAAKRAGNHGLLAKTLGVSSHRLSDWKTGQRPCPIEVQARLAELAGEDPKAWVWEVVRERLGKTLAAIAAVGAAVTLVCGLAGGAQPAAAAGDRGNVYYVN